MTYSFAWNCLTLSSFDKRTRARLMIYFEWIRVRSLAAKAFCSFPFSTLTTKHRSDRFSSLFIFPPFSLVFPPGENEIHIFFPFFFFYVFIPQTLQYCTCKYLFSVKDETRENKVCKEARCDCRVVFKFNLVRLHKHSRLLNTNEDYSSMKTFFIK